MSLLQHAWTTGLKDTNVFDDGKEEEIKPYKKNVAEESVLDEMPDEYPFNELKGGHTWHEWKGESVMEALGETNALDDGTTKDESFELGEHSLGRPFHKVSWLSSQMRLMYSAHIIKLQTFWSATILSVDLRHSRSFCSLCRLRTL